jgi:MoxR-like ATPase
MGFEVEARSAGGQRMTDNSIARLLEAILAQYGDARSQEPFGSGSSVWNAFEELTELLNRSEPVAERSTLNANWSAGRGNWARVPWIAFLDSRETTTTRRGVYPVLLFRQDLSGVYLTLAQGVTEPKERGGTAQAYAYLRGVAQRVRERCPELADAGFALDGNIDLRSATGLGKDYEASTIAYRLYERGSVPLDGELISDLGMVLAAYDNYIDTKNDMGELDQLAARFRQERQYPTDSDNNHLAAREELAAALSAENLTSVEEEPSRFDSLLFTRLAAAPYGGPGAQSRVHAGIQQGGDEARTRLARLLRHILYDTDIDEAQRIDDALGDERWQVYGFGESLAVKALAVCYPDRWIPVFNYAGEKGKKRLSQARALGIEPIDEAKFDTRGKLAVESNRRLREILEPVFPDDPWAQMRFLYWLDELGAAEQPQLGLGHLAEELLLDESWLEETVELLRHKRQLIFYGPPGTGKTYVARKLAQYIAQDPSRYRVVQFHPSYAYEDFVEGYRPVQRKEGGSETVSLELKPGPLLQLANSALESEADWCLLIDEINRGNISKVFGELYYLLEYREDEIELQYGDRFQMPKNLYIIGTMNTADRSIALLDAALRRRFHFVAFFPDQAPIKGLLRRWLQRHRPEMLTVADLVDRVNAMLPDRHLQIGPSHFMTPRLNESWLGKIWRGSVLPYIEEQFFDEPERAEAFRLDRLQQHPENSEERERNGATEPPSDLAAGVGTPDDS